MIKLCNLEAFDLGLFVRATVFEPEIYQAVCWTGCINTNMKLYS